MFLCYICDYMKEFCFSQMSLITHLRDAVSDLVGIIIKALLHASFVESRIAGNASRPPSLRVFVFSLITSRCSCSTGPSANARILLE